MATWITDRTQADIDRVKELAEKAKNGTWTEDEQAEWSAGMKGALSYIDYDRIESGIKELAGIIGAEYSPKAGNRTVRVETAKDSDGNIPAWTEGPSTPGFFASIIPKKDGLILKSLEFQIKGYLNGTASVYFSKYSHRKDEMDTPTDALVEKSVELVRGLNSVSVSMDSLPLEKDTEYQFHIYSVMKFHSPAVQPAQIIKNNYIDIVNGSQYCDDDSTKLFSGTVVLSEAVSTSWNVNSYLTAADASRWLENISAIRKKCSGYSTTPLTPKSLSYDFKVINQVESVLADIEQLAKDHLYYCSEPICGGEPYYAIC